MVGLFQMAAGLHPLGGVVDYISSPVVRGYVAGAGVLIAVGQLPNATGVVSPQSGNLIERLSHWLQHCPNTHLLTVLVATLTIALILAFRRINPRIPGGLITLFAAAGVSSFLDLNGRGLAVVSDIASVPTDMFAISVPNISTVQDLLPYAVACTVLSLVESAAVARSIASKTGQRLDSNMEFFGQGLANLLASFFNGYPISGSLARSTLNAQSGAQTRLAGVLSGVIILCTLPFLAGLVNMIPIAALAGLILVVAAELIQFRQIRTILRGPISDGLAMSATMLGTWFLPLDKAIYLGVGISLILFLRRARLVRVRDMVPGANGRLQEAPPETHDGILCCAIRILHVEGNLFFGAAGELRSSLDEVLNQSDVRVLIIRLKRTHGLDATTAQVLVEASKQLHDRGGRLMLVGLRSPDMVWLNRSGVIAALGEGNVIPTQQQWFAAMNQAIATAIQWAGQTECVHCPLRDYKPIHTSDPDTVDDATDETAFETT